MEQATSAAMRFRNGFSAPYSEMCAAILSDILVLCLVTNLSLPLPITYGIGQMETVDSLAQALNQLDFQVR